MNKPALSPDIKSVLVYVGGDLIGDALDEAALCQGIAGKLSRRPYRVVRGETQNRVWQRTENTGHRFNR